MKQTSFFDSDYGTELRDRAIEQVEENAPEVFKQHALSAVYAAARRLEKLTTDDVWKLLHDAQAPRTHEPRAMGAIMRRAVKAGWIRPLPQYQQSRRSACHRRPLRVYESLVIA